MRVLLLNQYYPPDTSATAGVAEAIAAALAERGEVTVLAGRPSYAPTERHGWYLTRTERQGDVAVARVGSTGYDRSVPLGRAVNYLTYLAMMPFRALTINPRPDVVVGMTDPPVVSIVGALVSRIMGVPFVYAVQDLHPDMAVAAGIPIPPPVAWLWDWAHRRALRGARRVVALGDDMGRRLEDKGVPPGRITVVRSGSVPLPRPETDGSAIRQAVRGGYEFVVMHAGNLGYSGDFGSLIAAARLLSAEGVRLALVGDGAMRADLERLAAGAENVVFLDFFPASELRHVLQAADLQLVCVRPALEGLVVPSKLYSILSSARPVLAAVPPGADVAGIVEREGCGVAVEPSDPGSITDAILALRRDPDRLQAMGEAAAKASARYDRGRELARFAALVEAATGKDAGPERGRAG